MDTLAPPHSNTSMRELAKPFDRKSNNTNVVIDTPKGCRNEHAFDFGIKNYKLNSASNGAVFFIRPSVLYQGRLTRSTGSEKLKQSNRGERRDTLADVY
jgi:hypothetical protein